MKVRPSVKKICNKCKVIKRQRNNSRICETLNTNRSRDKKMARISGVDLPRNKRLREALTYIFGIGRARANQICDTAGFPDGMRTGELTDEQTVQLRTIN